MPLEFWVALTDCKVQFKRHDMVIQKSALLRLPAVGYLVALLVLAPWLASGNASAQTAGAEAASVPGGPVRLRQPISEVAVPAITAAVSPARPGEFETFVGLSRFGADLVNELATGATDYSPIVPPEYIVQSGDELQITLWGSVDADLRLIVDRAGRVSIPRVGPVMVAGVRFGDLHDLMTRRVAQTFKNFELSVSLGRLRGVRVYVTGFVQRPGAYSVAGLSTVMNVVMRAGGPAAAGSFRQIELRRDSKLAGSFDLYDLLLRGDRSGDRLVQPDDVIHVLPAGTQVALRGSVNKQAVYELKAGDSLRELILMAGGFSPVADRSRVAIERLGERNAQRVTQIELPAGARATFSDGDQVRVFSAVEATLSVTRQTKRVQVDGEVRVPGEYLLPPDSTLEDALKAAGGLMPGAFLFATQFTRQSVRATQQESFDRALRDLETESARSNFGHRVSTADQAAAQAASAAASLKLIEQMRAVKPTGRIVLQLPAEGGTLPALALEDGDRLYIPARPMTVGVFGSVFNGGSYLHTPGRSVSDYLRLAGGPTRGADDGSTFVIRANGNVVSSLQGRSSWFDKLGPLSTLNAEPGDTIFVPEEVNKSTVVQTARDWTQIFFQLAVGLAGLKTVTGF